MRAAAPNEAQNTLAWLVRRRWAITALRENARPKLQRVEYVVGGAAAVADRRVASRYAFLAQARRSACRFWQGPRLPGRGRGDV